MENDSHIGTHPSVREHEVARYLALGDTVRRQMRLYLAARGQAQRAYQVTGKSGQQFWERTTIAGRRFLELSELLGLVPSSLKGRRMLVEDFNSKLILGLPLGAVLRESGLQRINSDVYKSLRFDAAIKGGLLKPGSACQVTFLAEGALGSAVRQGLAGGKFELLAWMPSAPPDRPVQAILT